MPPEFYMVGPREQMMWDNIGLKTLARDWTRKVRGHVFNLVVIPLRSPRDILKLARKDKNKDMTRFPFAP